MRCEFEGCKKPPDQAERWLWAPWIYGRNIEVYLCDSHAIILGLTVSMGWIQGSVWLETLQKELGFEEETQ